MTRLRLSLPVPGPRVPVCTATPSKPVQCASRATTLIQAVSNPDIIARTKDSGPRNRRTRMGQPLPIPCTDHSIRDLRTERSVRQSIGFNSESMRSSLETSSSSEDNEIKNDSELKGPTNERSRYNGPQLVEPCVGNALLHVLQPCGHRVMTRDVQLCGQNCKGSDTSFANARTQDKFVCSVCISRYVQEHYAAKKGLYIPSLDMLEKALGGFKAGWKDKRIARMERVWKNDALEEQRALEKLGRFCEAVCTDPEDVLVDVERSTTPDPEPSMEPTAEVTEVQLARHSVRSRRQIPVPTGPMRQSQLLTSASQRTFDKKDVESDRASKKATRIPRGPRLPRK